MLKQVHPDTGILDKAMAILNSFVNNIFECITMEAAKKTAKAPVEDEKNVSDLSPQEYKRSLEE
jgi:hypothetical protein